MSRSSSLSSLSSSSGSCQSKRGASLNRGWSRRAAGEVMAGVLEPAGSGSGRNVRNDRGALDLDERAILQEAGDLEQGHGGKTATHDVAPGSADLGHMREVALL